MPIPANRAKIQLARGNYNNLLANVSEFAEGELSYAKDQNLLYIKEEGQLIRLEYVTREDLDAAVEESIDLEVFGGIGLLTENGTVGTSPTTTLSIDEVYLREKVGITDSKEPAGFVDKTLTVIAHRPIENQIWLYPTGTSAAVWCQGIKHLFTTYKFVAEPSSTGLYYIYLNSSFNLQIKSSPFDYKNETPVCQIYWNQAAGEPILLLDRRHGIAMNWSTQEFLEAGFSPVIKSGFDFVYSLLNGPSPEGSTNEHSQFGLADGTGLFQDVKIYVEHSNSPADNIASNLFQQKLNPVAHIPVLYRSDTGSWLKKTATNYSYASNAGVPTYNKFEASWSLAAVTNGNYFISYIILTANTEYPIVSIPGQHQYTSLTSAQAASFDELILGDIDGLQKKVLYKVIYKYNTSYTNTLKTSIVDFQDFRKSGTTGIDNEIVDHGKLTGLQDDDHAQYVHISVNRTVTASHTHQGKINITNNTQSTTTASGAFTVTGGVGINGNLNVAGDLGVTLDGGNF